MNRIHIPKTVEQLLNNQAYAAARQAERESAEGVRKADVRSGLNAWAARYPRAAQLSVSRPLILLKQAGNWLLQFWRYQP